MGSVESCTFGSGPFCWTKELTAPFGKGASLGDGNGGGWELAIVDASAFDIIVSVLCSACVMALRK